MTAQQKKFSAASKLCLAEASTWGAYGKCMSDELAAPKRKKAAKKARRSKRRSG